MDEQLVESTNSEVDAKSAPTLADISYYRDYVHPLLFQVSTMFMQGKSREDILKVLGLSASRANQFELWFPDFRNAVTTGFISTNIALENALIQAAKGFEYEEHEEEDIDGFDGPKQVSRHKSKTIKKYCPPNIKAIELYLTNRAPDDWKKASVDNNTNIGTQIGHATVINIPDDRIKDMISELQNKYLQDTNPNVIEAETVDTPSESVFDKDTK